MHVHDMRAVSHTEDGSKWLLTCQVGLCSTSKVDRARRNRKTDDEFLERREGYGWPAIR